MRLYNLLSGRLMAPLPEGEYLVSVITEMELFSSPSLSPDSESRIREFLNEVSIVELTDSVKERTIEVRGTYARKLPDAIVAAAAIVTGADILTNDRKFDRVCDLKVRNLVLRA
jgi:predicted nucleic acid-binding protein